MNDTPYYVNTSNELKYNYKHQNLPANLSFTAWCANAAGCRGGRLHDNGALCGGTRKTCPAEYKG